MNPSHTSAKSNQVEQATSKPPVEADEVPTVILDASFFRSRSRSTESDAEKTNSSRTHTFPQR